MTRKFMMIIWVAALLIACRSNTIDIHVTFENLSGLQKNDPVLFQGNRAGYVKNIQFNSDGSYTVLIEIEEEFSNAVTEYSQFSLIDDPTDGGHQGIQIGLKRGGGTPLANGATAAGMAPVKDPATRLQKDIETGIELFKERMDQINREIKGFPQSREYQAFKKSLEDLASEIGKKEAHTREKIKRQWLPKIQRELDELKKRLKSMGREDELAPLEREVERIRRIMI
jgi:hypothetical protein